jgi:hypothetical protein
VLLLFSILIAWGEI